MDSHQKPVVRGAVAFVILSVIALRVTAAEKSPEVPFPDGYRSWQHVKSVVIGAGHPSFASEGTRMFHFYANRQAIEGYRAGRFPNGSVIVRETLRTTVGEGESKGVLKEGERSALDVMVKDDRLYKETGGWGFEAFDSKYARLAEKDRAQCYACHSKQKDHDLVFGTLRVDDAGTPYPEGYRHWTFLHSTMVPPTFDAFGKKPCEKPCMAGVFHFYANDQAMDGLRTGSYPDGAIIAEEMLEWISTANGGAKEGQRRVVGVMVKDSQRYGSTGGWGYGSFADGSRADKLDEKSREACHQCHIARKDQGYVFTEYRER
ncbi:MAG TPA: cytochrome P460 family protein [Bryobacteraceae bacterium]|nr:cytochrome P460 family protein [Bryobacteraceae bacterium]